jgi:hypothetical protein
MSRLCLDHGLIRGAEETKLEFTKRIISATRGDEKWHKCYKVLVDQCFKQRNIFRTSRNYFHFRGNDQRLRFDPGRLPPDFDLRESVFIVEQATPEGVTITSLTSQFAEDCFFYWNSQGYYISMFRKAWWDRIGGSLDDLLAFAISKIP